MATRDKLYELIYEKLSDWFRTGKTASELPPEVKAAAKKDPKIQKQLNFKHSLFMFNMSYLTKQKQNIFLWNKIKFYILQKHHI